MSVVKGEQIAALHFCFSQVDELEESSLMRAHILFLHVKVELTLKSLEGICF